MKMNFKHVAATALAVAMSLSLASPALAAGPEATPTPVTSGSLTVTGHELTDKNVFAVRMFTARAFDGTEEGPNYSYDSYTLEAKWEDFFKNTTYMTEAEWKEAGVIDGDGAPGEITDYSEAALKYLEWLAKEENSNKVPAFAEDAQDWLYEQDPAVFTVSGQNVTVGTGWNTLAYYKKATKMENPADNLPTGTATFDTLPTGYYVVFPEGGSTGNDGRNTDAMLINIPTDEQGATWNIKSTYPTVDKMVDTDNDGDGEAADNGSAEVGDTVTFTLKSTVPDMSDYSTFYFAFHDTLTKGLELVTATDTFAETDVEVYIYKEASETADDEHKVATTAFEANFDSTEKKLNVIFDNLKTVQVNSAPIEPGDTIMVTYRAKITEDAVSGSGNIVGNAQNDVYLEYSNNPSTTDKGTSTPDKSKVYTYDIKIEKYWVDAASVDVDIDDNWDGNHDMELESLSLDTNEKYLAGATFVLSNSQETPTKTGEPAAYGPEVVRLTGNVDTGLTVDPDGAVTEFTTKNAPIIIKGLEAGTYYLHEIDAPDGFNKLKEPVEIQIVVEPILGNDATNNATLDNPVYIIDDTANSQVDNAVKVENKKGIELPETGSIGTIGLTIAGVAIVLIGVFAPRKKKNNQE